MYHIPRTHNQVPERRNQRIHLLYAKPRLVTTRPDQVRMWDIIKLAGPRPGVYYSLYVIFEPVQPLRRRQDGRRGRKRRSCPETALRDLRKARNSAAAAHSGLRPGRPDDIQDGGVASGHAGRHENAQPAEAEQ